MRDAKTVAWLAVLLVVAPLFAADPVPKSDQVTGPKLVASPSVPSPQQPPPGVPVPCDPGKFVWLEVKGYTGPVTWNFSTEGVVALLPEPPAGQAAKEYFPGVLQGESTPQWHKSPSKTAVPCLGVKAGSVTISAWGVLDGKAKKLAALTLQVGPAPPIEPVDPVEPKPVPVTSFRVFIVFESGKTYSADQVSVMSGKVVEEWLDANCTGGNAGWRRRDQNLGGEKDPKFAELWSAIQPAITTLPMFAVEVNNKVKIIPLEKTPAEMVAKLKAMKEGK